MIIVKYENIYVSMTDDGTHLYVYKNTKNNSRHGQHL